MSKEMVSTFTKIKQFFARMLLIVTKTDGSGVPLAGTDEGALKVFLVGEDGSTGLTDADHDRAIQLQTLNELKRIRLILTAMSGEEASADQAEREE